MNSAKTLLFVLLALLCTASLACNSVQLKDDLCGNGAVVTGTAFSEEWGLASGLLVIPKGGKLPILKIAPGVSSTFGNHVEFLYGTTCLGHNFTQIGQVLDLPNPNEAYYVCNQGMNDEGLVVGFHNHGTPPGSPNPEPYDSKSPKKQAFNYFDLGAVLLARFRTCAEVKDALTKDFQVVYQAEVNVFRPGQWVALYDATGSACVVQFKLGKMEVLDNPLGVLANNNYPDNDGYLVEQTQKYIDFVKAQGMTVDANGFINGPFKYFPARTTQEPKYWFAKYIDAQNYTNVVGSYNGDARFARMATLKSVAKLQCYIKDGVRTPTSPGVAPATFPKNWPSLLTVRQIIEAVALPRGVYDVGTFAQIYNPASEDAWKLDATLWVALFDQSNKVMYYRVGNTVNYRMIELKNVNWSKVPKWPRVRFINLSPTPNPGVVNNTAAMVPQA